MRFQRTKEMQTYLTLLRRHCLPTVVLFDRCGMAGMAIRQRAWAVEVESTTVAWWHNGTNKTREVIFTAARLFYVTAEPILTENFIIRNSFSVGWYTVLRDWPVALSLGILWVLKLSRRAQIFYWAFDALHSTS